MSSRTVQNVVTYPGTSSPIPGRTISIQLNVPGFSNNGSTEILSTRVIQADDAGLWSVDLTPNSEIDPAGTYYTVREIRGGTIWTFVVAAGSGAVNLRDCLVVDPTNTNPLVAGAAVDLSNVNPATGRAALGLGTAATHPSTDFDAAGAASTAQAAAIAAAASDATTKVAAEATARTTAITSAVTALVNGAPGALDTLNELATALGDDASFATTVTNSLALKAPLTLLKARAVGAGNYKAGVARVMQPAHVALANRNGAPFDILFGPGTSVMVGTGSGTLRSARWIDRLVAMMREHFPVNGVIGGAGYGPGFTFPGGPTPAGTPTPSSVNAGLGNRATQLVNGTQTLTWGSQVGTSVTVYGTATTSADSITVTIDGGGPTTIAPGVTGRFSQTFALSRGSHLVAIGWVAGAPNIRGIATFDGDESLGIRMWDNSKAGSKTADWLTAFGGSQDWLTDVGASGIVNPSLILLDQVANDYTTISAATYGAQLAALITAIRGQSAAPIILWMPYRRTTSGIEAWDNYVTQAYAVAAAATGVAVLDFDPLINIADTGMSAWLNDSYHPNNFGQEVLARMTFDLLFPAGSGQGTQQTGSPFTANANEKQVRGGLRVFGVDANVPAVRVIPASSPQANILEYTDATSAILYAWLEKGGRFLGSSLTARGNAAGSVAGVLTIDANAGQLRDLIFATTTGANAQPSSRFIIRVDNSAETGSNAGSNLLIATRDDSGNALTTAISIGRSTALVGIGSLNVAKPDLSAPVFTINAAAATLRDLVWQTSGSSRWIFRVDNSAESGANAGSAFLFLSRDDTGAAIKTIFSVVRSSSLVTWGDAVNFAFNTSTGTKLGTATTQKIGFWNATPVVQPTRAGQLTDSSGGTPGVTVTVAPGAYSQSDEANFRASITAKVNTIETLLHTVGLSS